MYNVQYGSVKTYRFASPSLKRAALPEKIRATLVLPPADSGEPPAPCTARHLAQRHALHVENTTPDLPSPHICRVAGRSCLSCSCPASSARPAWTRAGPATSSTNPPHDLLFGLGNVGRFSDSKMKARTVLQVPRRVRLWKWCVAVWFFARALSVQ